MKKLKRMSVSEYKTWIKNPERFKASTKSFHKTGFQRTLNVLKGTAKSSSVSKWRNFKPRWEANINDRVTNKERIAVKNWGYKIVKG